MGGLLNPEGNCHLGGWGKDGDQEGWVKNKFQTLPTTLRRTDMLEGPQSLRLKSRNQSKCR